MSEIKVLSTKKLSATQQELLHNANISLKEYNAISIDVLPFKSANEIENAIVTSQNTARILIESKAQLKKVFCVGEKTTNLLIGNDFFVSKTAKNALELAQFIVKNHKNDSFLFFCGNKRRCELPENLTKNNVSFTEEILYNTTLNAQKFEAEFEGILFFSPSGIESYIQENSLENSVAFCIGNTTANEAKKYTSNIVVAPQATIESTIEELIRYFKG